MFWPKKDKGAPPGNRMTQDASISSSDAPAHFVSGRRLNGPCPKGHEIIYFGMGCFWGAERLFWPLNGVYVTAVGYQDGDRHNPSYEQVCTGTTGHAETAKIIFDPQIIALAKLLALFWEAHDPTQGNRQGHDVGSQYRSAIFTTSAKQAEKVAFSRKRFAGALKNEGYGKITTQIAPAPPFCFAEDYHQQYLAKNPDGYCGLKGTGVSCPVPA